MYPKFEKKNSHCQEEALKSLQTIFPNINMSQFTKKSSVWDVLERSAQNLPRPSLNDITTAISNMKTIVDSQQLKIQKNMIQIQEYQQSLEKKYCHSQQQKTNCKSIRTDNTLSCRKALSFDNAVECEMQSQQEHYGESYGMENFSAFEHIKKQEFFSQPEDIQYLENPLQNKNNFDEDDDVKKYLTFDF